MDNTAKISSTLALQERMASAFLAIDRAMKSTLEALQGSEGEQQEDE